MPIKPENKALYPANWNEIRASILKRAGNKCEFCGVANHLVGWRDERGRFVEAPGAMPGELAAERGDGTKMIRIVLTIAHLDHNPENSHPENLRALCQRCHNRQDQKHRAETRRQTQEAKARKADLMVARLDERRKRQRMDALRAQGAQVVSEADGQTSFLDGK
jgi:cytochrome c553